MLNSEYNDDGSPDLLTDQAPPAGPAEYGRSKVSLFHGLSSANQTDWPSDDDTDKDDYDIEEGPESQQDLTGDVVPTTEQAILRDSSRRPDTPLTQVEKSQLSEGTASRRDGMEESDLEQNIKSEDEDESIHDYNPRHTVPSSTISAAPVFVAYDPPKPLPKPPVLASSSSARIGPPSQSIPPLLRVKLEEWYAKNGQKVPPPATNITSDPNTSHKGQPALAWVHIPTGENLTVRVYNLDDGEYSAHRTSKRILVAEGPTLGPLIIKYGGYAASNHGIGYKIWTGIQGEDAAGFERKFSIIKLFTNNGNSQKVKETKPTLASKPEPARSRPLASISSKRPSDISSSANDTASRRDSKSLRPRNSITAPAKFEPTSLAETKRRDFPHWKKRKRDEVEDEVDASSLLNSFLSPAVEKARTPTTEKAAPPTSSHPRPQQSSSFTTHIKTNAVLLFYPKSGTTPRIRLFGACDSAQKLFAQAHAGDVFGSDAGNGVRVLAVRFGGEHHKARSLVEDDEQDFGDLLAAIEAADCWRRQGDGNEFGGSMTVEVRAK